MWRSEVYANKAMDHVKRSFQLRQENICRIGTETPVFAEDVEQRWCFMTMNERCAVRLVGMWHIRGSCRRLSWV